MILVPQFEKSCGHFGGLGMGGSNWIASRPLLQRFWRLIPGCVSTRLVFTRMKKPAKQTLQTELQNVARFVAEEMRNRRSDRGQLCLQFRHLILNLLTTTDRPRGRRPHPTLADVLSKTRKTNPPT